MVEIRRVKIWRLSSRVETEVLLVIPCRINFLPNTIPCRIIFTANRQPCCAAHPVWLSMGVPPGQKPPPERNGNGILAGIKLLFIFTSYLAIRPYVLMITKILGLWRQFRNVCSDLLKIATLATDPLFPPIKSFGN